MGMMSLKILPGILSENRRMPFDPTWHILWFLCCQRYVLPGGCGLPRTIPSRFSFQKTPYTLFFDLIGPSIGLVVEFPGVRNERRDAHFYLYGYNLCFPKNGEICPSISFHFIKVRLLGAVCRIKLKRWTGKQNAIPNKETNSCLNGDFFWFLWLLWWNIRWKLSRLKRDACI